MRSILSADTESMLVRATVTAHLPLSRSESVIAKYEPRCGYLFAAHKFGALVIVKTGVSFTDPQYHTVMERCASAVLEILEDRTHAVEIRTPEAEEVEA